MTEPADDSTPSDAGPDRDGGTSIVRYDETDVRAPDEREGHTGEADRERDRSGPLGDLAAAIDAENERSGGDAFDELFEREDVAEIDSDRLWDRIESDGSAPDDLLGDDREIREIEKQSYCHQCEHFAAPPTVGCTREGTAILEMPTRETFRVADCPIVLEDEELERRYE
ncbi:hypothetical protein ACFO5R_09425 [Halosolutus amylolyticus]|uniref:DUF8135 domain-containing protein n=1 Tax=Halosolutus amylolyticus TaxID=2932267 RepID=A0ABD5PNH3_9EURY|nr:hypothetical protein [Halosolutus amylolyticus]